MYIPVYFLFIKSPTIMSAFLLFEMTPPSSAQFLQGKDHFCSIRHMIHLDQSVLALSADGPLKDEMSLVS